MPVRLVKREGAKEESPEYFHHNPDGTLSAESLKVLRKEVAGTINFLFEIVGLDPTINAKHLRPFIRDLQQQQKALNIVIKYRGDEGSHKINQWPPELHVYLDLFMSWE